MTSLEKDLEQLKLRVSGDISRLRWDLGTVEVSLIVFLLWKIFFE